MFDPNIPEDDMLKALIEDGGLLLSAEEAIELRELSYEMFTTVVQPNLYLVLALLGGDVVRLCTSLYVAGVIWGFNECRERNLHRLFDEDPHSWREHGPD